jgi:hypothetical protein
MTRFWQIHTPLEARLSISYQTFHILALGSLNRHTDRHPMPFREEAVFHAALATISGIGAGFFPHSTGLWSSPHPCSARPSRFRAAHQTAQLLLATA